MRYRGIVLLLFTVLAAGCGNNDDENRISATGTIESVNVTLSSKMAGEIEKLLYDEGARITAGDTIMIIENTALRLQLRQAEASLMLAAAQLEMLRNGARKEDIEQAEAGVNQAKISMELTQKDKERMENLYKAGSITRKQLDDVRGGYDLMESRFTSAQENLNKLRSFARPEEIKQAEARVEQSSAARDMILKSIKDSYITAPINGFMVKKYFEEGESVSPMSSLVKLSDLSNLELMIYVSEEELGKVKLGQGAKIKTDTYKDKEYKGEVVYISPEAEFTPKNIQTKDERTKLVFGVKIKIPNPEFELKTGMPADAVIYLNNSD